MKAKSKSSNIKSNYLLVLMAVLIVAAAGVWLYFNIESHIVETDEGYSGEARTNKFLSAEYFLRKMGLKVKKIELLQPDKFHLNNNDTLFITSTRKNFDRRRSKQLMEWVRNGGNLIVTAQASESGKVKFKDFLLADLGLAVEISVSEDGGEIKNTILDVDIDDENFWQVDFNDSYSIVITNEFNSDVIWRLEDEINVHGLKIKMGQGSLTLLSDVLYFTNDFIDQYDHAAFLFLLANHKNGGVQEGSFYYSLSEDNPMLLSWLWMKAPYFLISIMLLITLVLWMKIPRFGPVINVMPPVRRQFIEHLYAAGRYQWQSKFHHQLLMDVRQQLNQRVRIKFTEWEKMAKNKQIKYFSELTGLNSQVIEKALFDSNITKENDFVLNIRILEKLRKSL